jgi:ribose transport system permease protein
VTGTTTEPIAEPPLTSSAGPPPSATRGSGSWRRRLSFGNVGILYVWAAIIVLFSILAPDTFPTLATVRSVLDQNAVSGLVALALVLPLSAAVFDLSVGSAMGLCNIVVAWLLVSQGLPIAPAIAIAVVAGLVIGLLNSLIVVGAKIDSFIGTLASGALMAAAVSLISSDQSILGDELNGGFGSIATTKVLGIALPVFVMLIVAVAIWFIQSYTVVGRRLYATGFNAEGARLAGIRTGRLQVLALVVSGVIAGVAGVLLASQVNSGSPNIGPPYLLDAFAAAFLGATQLGGRFNAWGTVMAVLLLGTGKTGLVLIGAQPWAQSTFAGVVLLVALALTNYERTMAGRSWIKARRGTARGAETGASPS